MSTTFFDYLRSPIFVYIELGTQLLTETVAELCMFLKIGIPEK